MDPTVELGFYGRPRAHWSLRFILILEDFFHNFQSLEIIGDMYLVSIYGGVLSLFVNFSRTKNINIPILGKKNKKTWKSKLREKNVEKLDKKLSDKNKPLPRGHQTLRQVLLVMENEGNMESRRTLLTVEDPPNYQ